VSGEGITGVGVAGPFVTLALGPARIVASITAALGGMRFARVSRAASEVPPVIVSIARERRWSAPFVIPFIVTIRAASSAAVARRSTVFVA
ncbi:MAG: hypothetical protein ACRD3C_03200, partial [Vicinamibacterales bacterium]